MVHAYWLAFKQLFHQPPERLELLDRSAGFLFLVVQDALAKDIQLTLSKLADPAKTYGKNNASLEHLLDEIQPHCGPAVATELGQLCQQFKDACLPVQKVRNKLIAHADRDIALRIAVPPDVTVAQITDALKALADFMNAIQVHFEGSGTAYEHFLTRGEGADDLVSLLRMAERYQFLQTNGKIPWDDLP